MGRPLARDNLVATSKAERPLPRRLTGLRVAISLISVFAFCVIAILWLRSFTWRDRMVVPPTNKRFCRIDSQHGSVGIETYGLRMGETAFAVTALSHADISVAWKRFTKAPEPGPNKRWRWETSKAGRFFVRTPHWFLLALSVAIGTLPWLPRRFSLRDFLIAVAALSALLGLVVWANSPP
jgi:hypothetical protein